MKNHFHENAVIPMNLPIRSPIWWPFLRFIFVIIMIALACIALVTAAQTKQPSEDRGNGNSAAENVDALNPGTTGSDNTAHGWSSLFSNTTGSFNTADGHGAPHGNSVGDNNTAFGFQALYNSLGGSENMATGSQALMNTIGDYNTANGFHALRNNDVGQGNVASGIQALYSNTTGNQNTAEGAYALYLNTTGAFNTASGTLALFHNTTGRENTAIGDSAGLDLTTGDGNVCIGYDVRGVAGEFNTTRIRNVYSSLASERPVYITSDNKLGTLLSTRRVKNDIKPMDNASEALFALKPVTFRYKKEIDSQGIPQFGLIAEDVAEVNPQLVVRDKEGKVNTVRYEQINAMLLNEFLKEHKKVEEQQVTISDLKKDLGVLTAQLKEQAAEIEKVSAQVEMRRPLTRVARTYP